MHQAGIATLIFDKAFITILVKYLDFTNVFFKKFAAVLLKHTKINTYAINVEKGKQPPYGPI